MSAESRTPKEPNVSERETPSAARKLEGLTEETSLRDAVTLSRSETSGTPLDRGVLKVQGKCPLGCGDTLYRAGDGRVFCVWHDCPNPLAATELLFGIPVRASAETQRSLFVEASV